MLKRAIFLDKDGTLVENLPYSVDPARIRLASGVGEGLRALSRAGYLLAVVSNQSGVARGYFPEAALAAVRDRLRSLFAEAGATLTGFYYCPHHREGTVEGYSVACQCRKPRPGLILRAAAEHRVSPTASWLVGDILDDVEAGAQAGCRTVLLDNGNETEWRLTQLRRPSYTVADFMSAACVILADPGAPP